jgi:transcriptional regulator with XRE-family HTH domain
MIVPRKELSFMSDFGERIFELRTKNNMSQGALADKLDVSRQTVSKWENCMCMPETEKLVLLSEIFNVSTDYILKGKDTQPEPVYIYVKDPETQNASSHNERIVRKYVGIVLAVIFTLAAIALLLIGGSVLAIIPGVVALLGVLLALNVKHPWLITAWVAYISFMIAAPFFTAINIFMIFDPIVYTKSYVDYLLIILALWAALAVLTYCTVRTYKRTRS